jgi:hypothetical protein
MSSLRPVLAPFTFFCRELVYKPFSRSALETLTEALADSRVSNGVCL